MNDADHFLVFVEVREALSVSKRAMQEFDMERLSLKKPY
jgi:hypothetical protein